MCFRCQRKFVHSIALITKTIVIATKSYLYVGLVLSVVYPIKPPTFLQPLLISNLNSLTQALPLLQVLVLLLEEFSYSSASLECCDGKEHFDVMYLLYYYFL